MPSLFKLYTEILLRENAKYNLTAITDPAEIQSKHFDDSLALLDHFDISNEANVLDIGSGAGFPGVPLKIARPDLCVVLLDSTAKKANFLRVLAEELELEIEVVCARAEEAARQAKMREQFDIVVSRAVAPLPMLCELCLPFVKPGGVFVAYKGARERTEEELAAAGSAIEMLGGKPRGFISDEAAHGSRSLVFVEKISRTPAKYPRNHGAMAKKPL